MSSKTAIEWTDTTWNPPRQQADPASPVDVAAPLTLAQQIVVLERQIAALGAQLRDEQDAAMLRALATAIGGVVFSVGDLRARCAIDPELADALGTLRPKQIGARLARIAGREVIEGVRLVRIRRDHAGCMWFVDLHARP